MLQCNKRMMQPKQPQDSRFCVSWDDCGHCWLEANACTLHRLAVKWHLAMCHCNTQALASNQQWPQWSHNTPESSPLWLFWLQRWFFYRAAAVAQRQRIAPSSRYCATAASWRKLLAGRRWITHSHSSTLLFHSLCPLAVTPSGREKVSL